MFGLCLTMLLSCTMVASPRVHIETDRLTNIIQQKYQLRIRCGEFLPADRSTS